VAVVVAIVVVIAILVAALAVTKTGPFSTNGTGGGGGGGVSAGETYAAAASGTSSSTGSVPGGPWTAIGGVGISEPSSTSLNSSWKTQEAAGLGCPTKLLSGASSITVFPGSSSSASSGSTPAWIILYSNASGGLLEVADFSGTATPLLTATSYGGCIGGSTVSAALPSNVIDSPAAAAAAMSGGGNVFASSHSSFFVEYILVPSVTDSLGSPKFTQSTWEVTLTNCNPSGTSSTTSYGKAATDFTASINSTTGAVIRAETYPALLGCTGTITGGKGTFASKATLITEYQANNSFSTTPTAWYNNATFGGVSLSLTLADFTVKVENNTTGTPISTTGLTLQVMNGTKDMADYNFVTNTWTNSSTPYGGLLSTFVLVLTSSMNMSGDKMVVTATASAPVTGSISWPIGQMYDVF
jgi:hypothetical protein